MSLLEIFSGGMSDCEPPLSRIVLKIDLKDAYKSGRFNSSKVKRRGTSEGFILARGGAPTAEETMTGGPTDTGARLVIGSGQGKEETDTGTECSGKDNGESEGAVVEVGIGETEKLETLECVGAKDVAVGEG